MLRRLIATTAVFGLVLAIAASSSQAGKFNKKLKIGDSAPTWSSIVGTDDKEHSLDDYKDADAVVLIFTCNKCPVAVAYEDRIIELQKAYQGKKVQVVAVNVNNAEGDRLDKMKERCEAKGFNFPYLYDSSQKIAVNYGAAVTPDVVLLDKERKVAYLGAIDDSPMEPGEAKKHYLRDAIDAVLAGKTPKTTETKPQGCGIQFE